MQGATTGWFGIRVDLLAFTIMLTLTLLCVIARDFKDINLIILSILLPSVLNIQDSLIWCLKTFMQLQGNMVAAERCMNLAKVPKERFAQGERPPLNVLPESQAEWKAKPSELMLQRPNWPEEGALEFVDVVLKYRPELETALNGLSFKINPGEKIGIVGRTGAGKSTITLAISRIVEIMSGQILIDGVDITKERLHEVRSKLTVIPQDATLFTGSLRFNLDPESKVADEVIINLLRRAELSHVLDNDPKGLD